MIPVIVRFDTDSVEYWYEVEVDSDRTISVGRDRNGVVCVCAETKGSYKQLRFLVTEESALAMASAITECLSAKPQMFAIWNKPIDVMRDAISALSRSASHDQS